ncbi:MAG: hypothetical protein AAFQ75_13060 [Pseudomonadota bacterium]
MLKTRRRFLAAALWAVAGNAVAHTPYGQWVVYRQKHLLIGAHRGDSRTYEQAKAVVAALEVELPAAAARVARGPHPQRIASLMGTGQLNVAVLPEAEAAAMVEGSAPFENYRPTPLTRLAALNDGYTLFAAEGLPPDHGWLIVQALDHSGMARAPRTDAIILHPGAAAYWRGDPKP